MRILLFFLVIGLLPLAQAIDVTECGTLDQDGATYNLLNNITSSSGSCIQVYTNNVTFNGQGHNVNNTDSNQAIYGCCLENFTLNNIFLYSDGSPVFELDDSISLYLNNTTIINSNASGILLYNISSANIINSNISNNYKLGGNYADIELINTKLNVSVSLFYTKIKLIVDDSGFMRMQNGINLSTDIPTTGFMWFDRQIFSWTKDNLTWNDNNATDDITADYNLSALYENRNYTVYNNSIAVSTLKTDAGGVLPQFSIDLSDPTTQIKVLAEAEPAPTKKKKHRAIIIN